MHVTLSAATLASRASAVRVSLILVEMLRRKAAQHDIIKK
jgi:hypothetical protein